MCGGALFHVRFPPKADVALHNRVCMVALGTAINHFATQAVPVRVRVYGDGMPALAIVTVPKSHLRLDEAV